MMSDIAAPAPNLPPLPPYNLTLLPPLIAPIPDKVLTLLLPIAAYWIVSLFFHYIDVYDYFANYRLHTPAEVLKRNRVSRTDVIKDVLIQQVIQTIIGVALGMTEPDDMIGKESYDITVWAQRIRLAQRALPRILAIIGVDAASLAKNVAGSAPMLSGAIAGGLYPLQSPGMPASSGPMPTFASWEMLAARAIYWLLAPACQFAVAIFFVDTWQYFLHRAMHMNQWLYRTFHSRHHRLYVPYAFGALYNHPFEGFLLDSLGAALAFKVAGMTTRQGMWLFTCSTIKTVDDHCGYALPWDPLQHLTSNNAAYHDVHHQSWGIKTNFAQPFFTFWDRMLGTVWIGGDVSNRYERARVSAQRKVDADSSKSTITHSGPAGSHRQDDGPYQDELITAKVLTPASQASALPSVPAGKATQQAAGSRDQVLQDSSSAGGWSVLADEAEEERQAAKLDANPRRSPRKSGKPSSSAPSQSGSLKGLKERVSGSFQGRRGTGVLGMESSR